jgi:molybdopterin converting factor small subunit
MQWIDANSKDASVLNRTDLSPVDIASAEGSERLVKKVQRHNKALNDLTERFEKLARDREELNRSDHWFDHDSKAVLAERRRVVAESWDVLVTLRKLLHSRLNLLQQLLDHLAGRIDDLGAQCNQAFEKAFKAISRANRDYLKAEPARAQAWVEEQAESDDAVLALQDQIAVLQALRERVESAYHRVRQGNALTVRQREVYEQLN